MNSACQPGRASECGGTDGGEPRVTAVVLAFRTEPWLRMCVDALLASSGVAVDVVLVDNGCTSDDVEVLSDRDGVSVVRPGTNLGFAGGCNAGAQAATGEYLALVNGDAIVAPDALARLVVEATMPSVAIAGASIRLSEDPRLVNAAGLPVHVLGLSWAGRCGEVERRTGAVEVAAASGACLLTHASWWRKVGGFDPQYFAYLEDVELSLRAWRSGWRVVYVPDAVVTHRYEASRNPQKRYWYERNRMVLLMTLWSWRSLVLLVPAIVGLELSVVLLGAKQGWARAKLRSYGWLLGHIGYIWRRRRLLVAERTVADRVWMGVLTDQLQDTVFPLPVVTGRLNAVMSWYWRLVRGLV